MDEAPDFMELKSVGWTDNKQLDNKSTNQAVFDSSRQHDAVVMSTDREQDNLGLNPLPAPHCCVSLDELISLSVPYRTATRTQ